MPSSLILPALFLLSPQDSDAPAWVGCWQATDGSEQVLLLERRRAGWLRPGGPSFHRLTAQGDELVLERWTNLTRLRAERDPDGLLHVSGDGLDLVLEPCAVPADLQVEPYAWPTGVEVEAETVETLTADLIARRAEDQRVRGFDGQPSPEQLEEMRRVDEDNLGFLMGVVEELGWIDAERFGYQAADAAFLIVQHCGDLRLMRTALPLIEADVLAGRLGGQAYALLYDRLQLNLGYPQRYGSQLGRSDAFGLVLMPCEDLQRVDELRAEMGMGTLAGYLELFRASPDAPPPEYLPDLLERL